VYGPVACIALLPADNDRASIWAKPCRRLNDGSVAVPTTGDGRLCAPASPNWGTPQLAPIPTPALVAGCHGGVDFPAPAYIFQVFSPSLDEWAAVLPLLFWGRPPEGSPVAIVFLSMHEGGLCRIFLVSGVVFLGSARRPATLGVQPPAPCWLKPHPAASVSDRPRYVEVDSMESSSCFERSGVITKPAAARGGVGQHARRVGLVAEKTGSEPANEPSSLSHPWPHPG